MALIREDIQRPTAILHGFGEVTSLVTNLEKILVAPIRCTDIDLDMVLENFPAKRATFPMIYLGLPLSMHHQRRIDLQPLVDKVAGKLVPWQGGNITAVGTVALVKAIPTEQATYHITPLV